MDTTHYDIAIAVAVLKCKRHPGNTATHYDSLQHTATSCAHCNTLQRTATSDESRDSLQDTTTLNIAVL